MRGDGKETTTYLEMGVVVFLDHYRTTFSSSNKNEEECVSVESARERRETVRVHVERDFFLVTSGKKKEREVWRQGLLASGTIIVSLATT
jgi:hypothetical protein